MSNNTASRSYGRKERQRQRRVESFYVALSLPDPSPFALLGVGSDADLAEIKSAYRDLAKVLHPDKNGNSAESKVTFQRLDQVFKTVDDEEGLARQRLLHPAESVSAEPVAQSFPGRDLDHSRTASVYDQTGKLRDQAAEPRIDVSA